MIVDAAGQIIRDTPPAGSTAPRRPVVAGNQELKPGQSRKEIEGVFVADNGHAVFRPIKAGIAGDKYFEVLDGLKEGDQVITGPFNSVRSMKDGDPIKITTAASPATGGSTTAGKS
jgi:HlyD family secretion protein